MRDRLFESSYTGNISSQLSRLRRSHVQKGIVLLGDAKRRCDSSCRDDVTLRIN